MLAASHQSLQARARARRTWRESGTFWIFRGYRNPVLGGKSIRMRLQYTSLRRCTASGDMSRGGSWMTSGSHVYSEKYEFITLFPIFFAFREESKTIIYPLASDCTELYYRQCSAGTAASQAERARAGTGQSTGGSVCDTRMNTVT